MSAGSGTTADLAGAPTWEEPPWQGLSGDERHAACLAAARAGDARGLDTLVVDLTPAVWAVARTARLDAGTAEDVVQTTWLALLEHLDDVADPRALVGWLATTTRREAWRRAASAREAAGEVAVPADPVDPRPTPEAAALRDDRDRELWRCYLSLTPRCQELLAWTVLRGRADYRVVGAALGMPHGSIGPTRGRCLAALRRAWTTTGAAR